MKPDRTVKRRILRDCAAAMWPSVAVYALGDLAAYCLSVFSAGELGSFFDAVLALDLSRAMGRFWLLLAALLANTVAVPAFNMGGEVLMFVRTLKHDRMCISRYLRKRWESARALPAGEIAARLEDDPIELRCDWVNLAEKSILVPLTLAYLLVRSLRASPLYTLITLGILAAKLLLPFLLRKTNAALLLRDREYRSAVEAAETQISQQAHAVRLFGLKTALIGRLDELYKAHYAKTIRKSALYKAVEEKTLSWLDTFCYLCILLAGAWLLSRGQIAAGAILAMMGFFDVFDLIAADTGEVIKLIPKLRTDLERMALFYTDPEPDGAETDGFRELTVENASFSRNEKPIFSSLGFTLRAGERLAVTGPNGSGKSTLLRILCGLQEGYTGRVAVNGADLRTLSPTSWRRQFRFVEQDPYLFEGTVFENVRIGRLTATDAEVQAVMERLEIAHLAQRHIPYGGGGLSGGERQRVAIARALLSDAPLLLFDEPDNNLDADTRTWMADFIASTDRTVLFVSHDEALLRLADRRAALGR